MEKICGKNKEIESCSVASAYYQTAWVQNIVEVCIINPKELAITNKESTAKEKQPLKELAITNKESTITGCRKKSKTEGDQMNTRGRR